MGNANGKPKIINMRKKNRDLPVPEILKYLKDISWEHLEDNLALDNLSITSTKSLKMVINKNYYCDRNDEFIKNFGIKVRNLYDLSFTSINSLKDEMLVLDDNYYCFSCYDLKRFNKKDFHPYMHNNLIGESRLMNIYGNKQKGINTGISIIDYYLEHMAEQSRSNTSSPVSNTSFSGQLNSDDPEILKLAFEQMINHDFFTINLIDLYHNRPTHLDYTVGLIYYVISVVDDYKERYRDLLKDNYCQVLNINDEKYVSFLKNTLNFLNDVKVNTNIEKFQYICIIVFKILQYRFIQITEGECLYELIKKDIDPERHQQLYWSIILDRPNYYYQRATSRIHLMNINIDNIFTNCEFTEYFYTLISYLHSKYMRFNKQPGNPTTNLLNLYKTAENYSYLDLIRYFTDVYNYVNADQVSVSTNSNAGVSVDGIGVGTGIDNSTISNSQNNQASESQKVAAVGSESLGKPVIKITVNKLRFRKLVKRYYLSTPIYISHDGLISDL